RDAGRIRLINIFLLTRSGNVMGAANDTLHPAKPRISRRTDLFAAVGSGRDLDKAVPSSVQPKLAIPSARANHFIFKGDIDEIIFNGAGDSPELRRTRSLNRQSFEQPHRAIHGQTEIRDHVFFDLLESFDQVRADVSGQLTFQFRFPPWYNALQVKRRVKLL